jgi:hypothetical protein
MLGVLIVLAVSGLGLFVPTSATPVPTRTLTVSGIGTEMYPTFDPTIDRYALTTTDLTAGSVLVTATTDDLTEHIEVNGTTVTAATPLTGLQAGDVITVAFLGGAAPHTYTVIYLPSGFPKLTATWVNGASLADVAPGLVAVTLFPFGGPQTPSAYDAIVDRNGVPVYAQVVPNSTGATGDRDFDLKQQPTGEVTVQRPTTPSVHSYSVAVLDPLHQFQETSHREMAAPLTNTDFHDSLRMPDGSTVMLGYQPNSATGKTDATVQKIDAAGHVTFQWSTAPYADETMAGPGYLGSNGDYAHVNSVVSVDHGDLIVSFRHMSAVFRIATVAHDGYQPGDVIWKLGGRDSSFTFVNDDTTPGPCGQHAVSELPGGHILIFDNGSNGLCVDPSDPLGPAIDRGFTRITEYALDTVAHTATLVWSYVPGKYSVFAGSARRMLNGNTLIAWASNPTALASEVDHSDPAQVLWELTTPDNGNGNSRYISYRAELIAGPQIVMTGPADGATVAQGTSVPASATCTDWVSNALASCVKTGLVGGSLDTSTLGTHTWTVTSVGGAGVTSSESRRYTVRDPRWQPDGLIRKGGSSWWKGGNLYGSATDQTIRQHARRRHTVKAFWQVQNDGERADSFRLLGTAGTSRYKVHYFAGGTDVTRSVVAGTYRTATLAPGATVTLRVEVKPTRRARVGRARTFTLRATSVTSAVAIDRVATRVTARR